MALTGLPGQVAAAISGLQLPTIGIMLVIVLFYAVLGCIMDALAMVLLTIPVIYPLVTTLGYDPIWFGVLLVMEMELGLITPPVGVNVFVVQACLDGLDSNSVFRAIWPFWASLLAGIVLIILIPEIALFIPSLIS